MPEPRQITTAPHGHVLTNSVYYRSTYGYSPSGGLYQGTERGLLRVEALVPKPSTLALALGGIAWSAWGGRTQ